MTTTVMRDSIVGDAWIQQTAANVPIQRIIGADGQPTGDILTGPVRLAFCDSIFNPESKDDFSVAMLFTPYADFRVLYEEYYAWCGREFPSHYDAGTQQYHGLHSPFKSQDEKLKFGGFTPGLAYMNSGSQFKPPVCDSRYNPIVDPSRLYAGVWAICAVKPYPFGKAGKTKDGQPMKKGIGFGLQSIMLIGDDTKFGGGAPDVKQMYAGVNVTAPIVRPDIGGGMPTGGAPAPAAGIPGYTAPGGGAPRPGQPAGNFVMPQTTYSVPAQPQGFTPPQPGAPASYAAAQPQAMYAPPATSSHTETPEQAFAREMAELGC